MLIKKKESAFGRTVLARQEMTMDTLLTREVYIRLNDDKPGFVCTVTYGKFYAKSTEFTVCHQASLSLLDDRALVLARKRPSRLAVSEQ